MKIVNLVGQRYGSLLVVTATTRTTTYGHRIWECLCDCGRHSFASTNNLRSGSLKSCGCRRGVTHGKSNLPEHNVWKTLRQRCSNKSNPSYKNYGGRGIKVCARWDSSFENFMIDMGPRPSPRHTIERRDNNGPYSPDNCRWATRAEQNNNTRWNRILVINGERMTLSQAARRAGITPSGMRYRLRAWHSDRDLLE